jgi:hypothetical protein
MSVTNSIFLTEEEAASTGWFSRICETDICQELVFFSIICVIVGVIYGGSIGLSFIMGSGNVQDSSSGSY